MVDSNYLNEIKRRRTFAIISHPDAGKTTLTEKLLLFGGAIQLAGTVKARKAARHATSDWMALEKERGISVTSSVMQFHYNDAVINLLDTPGHADFSEDTYRTLTAVDSALMVIDVAKGVEERTIKLMDVCRLRDTPILTFINKLDREGKEPIDLLDEVEDVLKLKCTPVTWPLGMGKRFKGIYHLHDDIVTIYKPDPATKLDEPIVIKGIDNPEFDKLFPDEVDELREEIELVKGASHDFDLDAYLRGELSPVFFGSALSTYGIKELLDAFVEYAPPPQPRATESRDVAPQENKFSGFVFKIQANMDPAHRDRVAFMRVCSGQFKKGKKVYNARLGRETQISNVMTFMAGDRAQGEEAFPGDIVGLPNHGTIQIGDTFSEGEILKYTGIPNFAPELFRRARLRDPLRMKALLKGLQQLAEEGASQLFRPFANNDLILGAVGILQFEVVAYRLKNEYNVECTFEPVNVATARWVHCDNAKKLEEFQRRANDYLALDGAQQLTYIAPTMVNLNLAIERYPDVEFRHTREV